MGATWADGAGPSQQFSCEPNPAVMQPSSLEKALWLPFGDDFYQPFMMIVFFFSQYNPTIPSHGGDNPPSRLCGAGAGETGETASAAASGWGLEGQPSPARLPKWARCRWFEPEPATPRPATCWLLHAGAHRRGPPTSGGASQKWRLPGWPQVRAGLAQRGGCARDRGTPGPIR